MLWFSGGLVSKVNTRITVKRRGLMTVMELLPRHPTQTDPDASAVPAMGSGRLAWLAALTHSEEPSWGSHWPWSLVTGPPLKHIVSQLLLNTRTCWHPPPPLSIQLLLCKSPDCTNLGKPFSPLTDCPPGLPAGNKR